MLKVVLSLRGIGGWLRIENGHKLGASCTHSKGPDLLALSLYRRT